MIERFNPLKGEMLQILDETGQVRSELEPDLEDDLMKLMYTLMVKTRAADDKALKMQRQGRMGTYGANTGHEACQVGTGLALTGKDWFFPYFRDLGAYLALGFPLKNYYLYWMGNEEGMRIPQELNIFPICVPVGSQIPQAVGAGMAAGLRGDKIGILCTFSDGATSEGDFHEALNFAGVYKTPNVFVCFNNQYAISHPRDKQSASKTLAQKALAYGFDGILVDGNDILAVYTTVKEALRKARSGGGPTLIEAFTYRMSDHTTSDDASRYRDAGEVESWRKKDPITRFKAYLTAKGLWDERFESAVVREVTAFVNRGVEEAEATPPPTLEEIFSFTYKVMPPHLRKQFEELSREHEGEER